MLIDMTHTITPEIPIYPGTPVPSLSPACTSVGNYLFIASVQIIF